MLFITGTTLNVPSLMGARSWRIGVATANSILVVTFANDERCAHENKNAFDAALAAGFTRLRPVIMTALAMIIGMLPMSLGLGEGGEQKRAARARRDWRVARRYCLQRCFLSQSFTVCYGKRNLPVTKMKSLRARRTAETAKREAPNDPQPRLTSIKPIGAHDDGGALAAASRSGGGQDRRAEPRTPLVRRCEALPSGGRLRLSRCLRFWS